MDYAIKSPDEFVTMPWKNGQGSTVEIYREDLPGSDNFAWRLSMADVSNDGAFSYFNGYDRTLLLLEGTGLTLTYDNGLIDLLDAPLQAAYFRGEAQTLANLLDGPIKDFNVMALRGHCSADVFAHPAAEAKTFQTHADVLLIYAVAGDIVIQPGAKPEISLPAHCLLVKHPQQAETITCAGGAFIATQISLREK